MWDDSEGACASCGACEAGRRQNRRAARRSAEEQTPLLGDAVTTPGAIDAPRRGMRGAMRSSEPSAKHVLRGGTSAEILGNIKANGLNMNVESLRKAVLSALEVKPTPKAENLIRIGCVTMGAMLPLRAYCLLLERLGTSYSFFDKEYCCGTPLIARAVALGEDTRGADEASKELLGVSVSEARASGARNIVYFCQWCCYLGQRFYSQSDIGQVFAPDLLVSLLPWSSLKLNLRIAYFGNTPHRRPIFVPDDYDHNWSCYKGLLGQIDGLDVYNLPSYCCQLIPEKIFERTAKAGRDILVTTCTQCYLNLRSKARRLAPQIKVKHLYTVLLAALENDSRVLDWM